MAFVAHESVEIVGVPERSRSSDQAVGAFCGKGFPAPDDLGQRVAIDNFDDYVDMIGHYAPGQQSVALAIKMEQGAFYKGGNIVSPQPTSAQANVQFSIQARQRMVAMPKRFRHVGRQAVGQPERDELDRFRRIEMR